MKFKDMERRRGEELIKNSFFDGDEGGGIFRGKRYSFVLQNGLLNLYPDIRKDVLKYFRQNNIAWWGGKYPTGHILSSQIACLNHLFTIRNDKKAVLKLLTVKSISENFIDIFPISENFGGYIQFEAVGGDVNYLNEGINTRGANCTSIDALIYAKHRDGRRFLIPIEWKYVEVYGNDDKSMGSKGNERKSRYLNLIANSKYLNDNTLSCCWFEPFYQLMRQTLWTEQLFNHQPIGLEFDDYLHLHVIPCGNTELLNKSYPCSNLDMKETWKSCLIDPDKYIIISPKDLWSKQSRDTEIYRYLSIRYWQ